MSIEAAQAALDEALAGSTIYLAMRAYKQEWRARRDGRSDQIHWTGEPIVSAIKAAAYVCAYKNGKLVFSQKLEPFVIAGDTVTVRMPTLSLA